LVLVGLVFGEICWWTFLGCGLLDGLGVPYGGLIALVVVPPVVLLIRVEEFVSERRRRSPRIERAEDAIARGRAKLLCHDDFGRLWEAGRDSDGERRRVVEVVNATPEEDGSSRHYFLRVPPSVRTAREAIAWTFGLRADEYVPVMES
jgi:hypothetical protein